MSDHYLNYLKREHARLDAEIAQLERQLCPDQFMLARLKKLKLAVKDQITACRVDQEETRAA